MSEHRPDASAADDSHTADGNGAVDGGTDIGDLFDELEELEDIVDTPEEREQVRDVMEAATEVQEPVVFGRVIWGFDRSDLAEAVLGSLLFGIPMAVEGGTNEAGEFLAARPLFLASTLGATVGLVISILYVADIQDVRIRDPILGLVPRRLVGVLGTAFVTAVALLTVWGRIDWAEPSVAFATCVVALFPMAIGAALGDILPGS